MTKSTITRRDFLNGTLIGTGALLMGGDLIKMAQAAEAEGAVLPAGAAYYPPSWNGMRGSHDGSFERAHELAREGRATGGLKMPHDEQGKPTSKERSILRRWILDGALNN
jgi:hypothetical protein